jgi:uncharacterized protein (DUF305 family)
MKILIQSIIFIAVVAIFVITSDRLANTNSKENMQKSPIVVGQSGMSDEEFLDKMIEHHEEAIAMSEQILLPTDRSEIHTLATNIIVAQTKEIETMKQWKKEWYGK